MAEEARLLRISISSGVQLRGLVSTTQKEPKVCPSVVVSGIPVYAISPSPKTDGSSLNFEFLLSGTIRGSPDATTRLQNECISGVCRTEASGSGRPTLLLKNWRSPSTSDTSA